MPTTRSKTGSLPAKKVVVRKKVKTETTKDDTTSHVPRTTQDLKAKIGDDDKFSVLPMEILTTIFEFCHIYSLAMLARSNKSIRAFLTSTVSRSVWEAARMNMTVFQLHVDSTDGRVKTYYSRTGVHDDDDDDADWFTQGVNECRIPEPLPGMSEMQHALQLFSGGPSRYCSECFFCGRYDSLQTMGQIARDACRTCRASLLSYVAALKSIYVDDNLPDLFWTALATWKGRVLTRDFETLKAKLEDFEIECNFDEAAVCKWLKGLADELKAIDVSQFEEDVAQWRAWDANIVEQEEEKAVVTNKGLIREQCAGYEQVDIQNFLDSICSHVKGMDKVMTVKQAKEWFRCHQSGILAIRDKRLEYEAYHAETLKRDCLKTLLGESLQGHDLDKKENMKPCDLQLGSLDNRIVQFSKLKSLSHFFRDLDAVAGLTDSVREAWRTVWPAVFKELAVLHRKWQRDLQRAVCVYLNKTFVNASTLKNFSTVFRCTNCQDVDLRYPEILDHECCLYGLVKDTPSSSSESQKSRPGEFSAAGIWFDQTRYARSMKLITAIRIAGGRVPTMKKPKLNGWFRCAHCEEDKKYDWSECLSHFGKSTVTSTVEPNGVHVTRRADHDRVTFLRDTAACKKEETDDEDDSESDLGEMNMPPYHYDSGDGYDSDHMSQVSY